MILVLIRVVIFLFLTMVLLPFQTIIILFLRDYSYLIPSFFHFLCSKIFGIRIKIFGKISKHSPTLFISNHASYLDILILGSLLKTSFVAKKEVSKWPLLGILAKLQNTIFIDRKIASVKKQKNKVLNHLNMKKNLVIFPEGTSSDGNKVLPFKSSLFNIFENKKNSKIYIQPIAIVYKKVNGILIKKKMREKITWHSDMKLIPNIFNVLKKKTIDIEVNFNNVFLPSCKYDRKEIALYCWEKVNSKLINGLNR